MSRSLTDPEVGLPRRIAEIARNNEQLILQFTLHTSVHIRRTEVEGHTERSVHAQNDTVANPLDRATRTEGVTRVSHVTLWRLVELGTDMRRETVGAGDEEEYSD